MSLSTRVPRSAATILLFCSCLLIASTSFANEDKRFERAKQKAYKQIARTVQKMTKSLERTYARYDLDYPETDLNASHLTEEMDVEFVLACFGKQNLSVCAKADVTQDRAIDSSDLAGVLAAIEGDSSAAVDSGLPPRLARVVKRTRGRVEKKIDRAIMKLVRLSERFNLEFFPADASGDGPDELDINIITSCFGKEGRGSLGVCALADINNNYIVNSEDLADALARL